MADHADLAEVLRRYGPAYRATHTLSPARERVWRAIVACRTAVLGGQVETCPACGATRHVYHSCRNRHCPRCQTRAKEAWLAARRREVLPVPYFHLVFTLPHDLNGLIGQRSRRLYETLFGAVSATLTEFAANPRWLGGTPAFSLVLHTWKQDLGRHVHLHALIAGGALSAEGTWLAAKPGFLFPVRALSRVFRGQFVAALAARDRAGELGQAVVWDELKRRLFAQDWVVYAKAPVGGPAQVLEYLSRYSHRVAISNERLVGLDGDGDHGVVRFRVRDSAHGNKKRTLSLPAETFIDRFLLHVLPKGFKRIRHYGLLGPAGKAVKLAQARAALGVSAPDPVVAESVEDFMRRIERLGWSRCRCGETFGVTAALAPMPERRPWPQGPP
jgi:hypothetical protein